MGGFTQADDDGSNDVPISFGKEVSGDGQSLLSRGTYCF